MTRSAPAAVTDPAAAERDTPGLLDALRAAPETRVIAVRGDLVPQVAGEPAGLHAVDPDAVPAGAEWAFLGRDDAGHALLVAAFDADAPEPLPAPGGWEPLRTLGTRLGSAEAATLVLAVGLGRWLTGHRFCPSCGGRTALRGAGWARRCPSCGREHFPRNDPAVIVAITDDDRSHLLLGANAAWMTRPGGPTHSCFAGFVETGESLETAIHREMAEEAGVRVRDLRYVGSQPWPFPHSLMLGFEATAVQPDEARPDGTEIIDLRWFGHAEIGEALAGRGPLRLPAPLSIAHRLIRAWHEEPRP